MNNERRIAEEALRESEQRWRSLTEALPQLVWSTTPDGANDYVSPQWTEYTGVAESELLGSRWMDVLHPDDRQSIRQIWTDSVAGRRAYDVEYRVRRHDGTYGWFKTRGVPIRDSNGNIVKWFGSCTDITDRKRAEEALRESEQELRKAPNELEKKVAERTAELHRSEAYLAEAQRLTRTGSWALTVATREMVVAAADLLRGGNEVEEDLLAIGLRLEQMLNRERKILAEPGGITNEPRLAREPSHPFGCLDLFGRHCLFNDPLGIVVPRDAFDALVRDRHA